MVSAMPQQNGLARHEAIALLKESYFVEGKCDDKLLARGVGIMHYLLQTRGAEHEDKPLPKAYTAIPQGNVTDELEISLGEIYGPENIKLMYDSFSKNEVSLYAEFQRVEKLYNDAEKDERHKGRRFNVVHPDGSVTPAYQPSSLGQLMSLARKLPIIGRIFGN